MSITIAQQNKDVLEAEVPSLILDQFKLLNNTLQKNNELAQEFLVNSSADEFQKLDVEILKVSRLLKELKNAICKERTKNYDLSKQVVRDSQMAEQINRRYEMLGKNLQYGRSQAIEYMHEIADEHEECFLKSEATIAKAEELIKNLLDNDKEVNLITEKDLSAHIERFDQIFAMVASQVCNVNNEVEKLKDTFLEYQYKIYGRYLKNPFEKRKERQKLVDAFSNIKGIDAFPSQQAVLSLSEFLPKQNVPGGFGVAQPFNTNSSVFTNSLNNTAFTPKQPAVGNSMFGSIGTTSTASSLNFMTPLAKTTTIASTGFAFGAPNTVSSGNLMFGTTSTSNSTSLFGAPNATSTPATNTALFGAPTATSSSASATSLFGAPNAISTPAFGALNAASTPAFSALALNSTPNAKQPLFGAPSSNLTFNSGTSLFGASALNSTPNTGQSLFGASAASNAATPAFGNTLNSATSGTLFQGSAPTAKPLFGAK